MLRHMLDTNICIEVMRADATTRLAGWFSRFAEQLCISSIVLAELHFSADNSQLVDENLEEIDLFVTRLQTVLDFDAVAAADYGRIRVALRGAPIGPLDTLIAAHARSRDLVLVTSNTSEFSRVPGLQTEVWD